MNFPYAVRQLTAVSLFVLPSLLGWSQATLPVSRTVWNGGEPIGWTISGTPTLRNTTFACSGSNARVFDDTNDQTTVNFNATPGNLVFKLKRATMSGESSMLVEESANGSTWTQIGRYGTATGATAITDCANITIALNGASRYVRWTYTKATGNCDLDDVSIAAAPFTAPIANTGTPAAANVIQGTSNHIFSSFTISPTVAIDFTAATVRHTGTATGTDVTNLRIVYDVNGNGVIDVGDNQVSNESLALAGAMNFTFSSQTGFSTPRRYLVVGNVAAGAVTTRTVITGINAATDYSTTGTEGGTATGNTQTIIAPPNVAFTATAVGNASVPLGTVNRVVYQPILNVTNAPATLNGFQFTTAGTYAASDLVNIQLWYQNSTPFAAGSATLLGTLTSSLGPGAKSFTGLSQVLPTGTSYLFVTMTVNCNATVSNTFTINATTTADLSVAAPATKSGAGSVATGNLTVSGIIPGQIAGLAATPLNESLAITWANPTTCFDEVMVVARAGAAPTGTPTGNGSLYTANASFGLGTAFGGGFVVYEGTGSSFTLSNLINLTTYQIFVFTRKNSNWNTLPVTITAVPSPPSNATDYFRSKILTGNWSDASSWETSSNNVAWFNATLTPTAAATSIQIRANSTINIVSAVTADDITVQVNATLNVNDVTFTLANGAAAVDMQVDGTVNLSGVTGEIVTTGALAFGSGANYVHNRNAGTIPTATWDANSTCTVTGMTNTTPTTLGGIGQAFGHFTWNNPAQGSYVNVESNAFSVAGLLTVGPTANVNNKFSFANSGGPFTNTINRILVSGGQLNGVGNTAVTTINVTQGVEVTGGIFAVSEGTGTSNIAIGTDLTISGGVVNILFNASAPSQTLAVARDVLISGTGRLNLEALGSTTGIATLTVGRHFVSTGTTVGSGTTAGVVDFGTGTVGSNAIRIRGNFTKSGSGTFGTVSGSAATGFVFDGTSPQTFSYSGANSPEVNYTVAAGASLQLLSNLTVGSASSTPSSSFTVAASGTLDFSTFSLIAGSTTQAGFAATAGSTLITSNADGLGGVGTVGSLQSWGTVTTALGVGRASLPGNVNYTFNGNTTTPFPPAGGFGAPGLITINAAVTHNLTTNLTVNTGVTVNNGGRFNLNPTTNNLLLNNAALLIQAGGTFDNNGENQVTSGGGTPSVNIFGTFITRDAQGFTGTNAAIPGITPTLQTGSTIEFGRAGNQPITIRSDYFNLRFTGGGIKSLAAATAIEPILGTVTIPDNTTVDALGNRFGSNETNFVMADGRFRTGINQPSPQMGGTYTITGGVVEFYGPLSGQTIRNRTYFNVEVNGNVGNGAGIIGLASGGSFRVLPGATFTINANVIEGPIGAQTVIVENGGTFQVGKADGFSGTNTTVIRNNIETVQLDAGSTVSYMRNGDQAITNTVPYHHLILAGSGTKTAPSGITEIRGNLTRETGTALEPNGGTVRFVSTSGVQTYTSANDAPPIRFHNLDVQNSSTDGLRLVGSVDVENALALASAARLDVADTCKVTLRSTATNTARLAPVPDNATIQYGFNGSNGKFVVERYYPGRRAWRLVTAPVTATSAQTVFNSWQVGGAAIPGSGTYVSGPGANLATNGMDPSPMNNPSLRSFNPSTSGFVDVLNTRTTVIAGSAGAAETPDNRSFFMFIRGDRTPANVSAFYIYGSVLPTTLRDTGRIQIKRMAVAANATGGLFTLLGNPYASPVDFAQLEKNNVHDRFWAWDPNLNQVGGYVLLDAAASPAYNPVKVPLSSSGTIQQTQQIQSKQAVFVQTIANGAASVVFRESYKTDVNNLGIFRPAGVDAPTLGVNLHLRDSNGISAADGVVAQFAPEFSSSFDGQDGIKFGNVHETMGWVADGQFVALNRRKPVVDKDTLFLRINRLARRDYRFELLPLQFHTPGLNAWLEDTHTKLLHPIRRNGSTEVDFTVNAQAGSNSANRFRIVFRHMARFMAVQASMQQRDALVEWTTGGEFRLQRFEIERSSDKVNFRSVGMREASVYNDGSLTYRYTDINLKPGKYYYRIKGLGLAGEDVYSDIVEVEMLAIPSGILVYPNPVTESTINLHLNDVEPGMYSVRLLHTNGQVIQQFTLQQTGRIQRHTLTTASKLAAGTYRLEWMGGGRRKVISILVNP